MHREARREGGPAWQEGRGGAEAPLMPWKGRCFRQAGAGAALWAQMLQWTGQHEHSGLVLRPGTGQPGAGTPGPQRWGKPRAGLCGTGRAASRQPGGLGAFLATFWSSDTSLRAQRILRMPVTLFKGKEKMALTPLKQ